MKLKQIAIAVVATATTLASGIGLAPKAAAEPGNSVVFGDSIVANPEVLAELGSKLPGAKVNGAGCATDYTFSDAYGRANGTKAENYTCAGASLATTGQKVSQQIAMAVNNGALGPQTREVVVLAGANDSYPNVLQGPGGVENLIRSKMRDAVNQIRAAAPQARVKILGYPTIANFRGNACPINVVPGIPTELPANVGQWENAVQWGQVFAAQDTGAEFVDAKPISANHGMCSNSRWMVGIIDTTAPSAYNLGFHMTDVGLAQLGDFAGRA